MRSGIIGRLKDRALTFWEGLDRLERLKTFVITPIALFVIGFVGLTWSFILYDMDKPVPLVPEPIYILAQRKLESGQLYLGVAPFTYETFTLGPDRLCDADEYDIGILASTIYMEATHQPREGQIAVGYTVVNRAVANGISLEDALFAPGQFAVWPEFRQRKWYGCIGADIRPIHCIDLIFDRYRVLDDDGWREANDLDWRYYLGIAVSVLCKWEESPVPDVYYFYNPDNPVWNGEDPGFGHDCVSIGDHIYCRS